MQADPKLNLAISPDQQVASGLRSKGKLEGHGDFIGHSIGEQSRCFETLHRPGPAAEGPKAVLGLRPAGKARKPVPGTTRFPPPLPSSQCQGPASGQGLENGQGDQMLMTLVQFNTRPEKTARSRQELKRETKLTPSVAPYSHLPSIP